MDLTEYKGQQEMREEVIRDIEEGTFVEKDKKKKKKKNKKKEQSKEIDEDKIKE